MARILGLDIGARSVKALLVESSFRAFGVNAFTEVPLDEEGGLPAALQTLKEAGHLAADQIIVAAPGLAVATQLITLPFADPRRVDATIAFEVESLLPYDLDEVVFDYQVLGVQDGKSQVLVGTIRREQLAGLLETLGAAGIDPRVITTSALAYQNLFAQALNGRPAAEQGEELEAIVDIGHERTSICIGRGGVGIEAARTFAGGGKDLTRAVAAEFKVSLPDAEAWKENEGAVTLGEGTPPEVERAVGALLRGLAPVLREIRSTFHAHQARSRRKIARVYLAGGTARLAGLDALLARELGVEVVGLDMIPRGEMPAVPAGREPIAAQAFALAMRGHGSSRGARFNLRKGEYAFKGDHDYLKGKVSRLAAFAAILTVLTVVLIWSQFQVLSNREKALDQYLCASTQRVLGQCQKDYLVASSLLKGKDSPVASLPTLSALDVFAELTSRAQKVDVKLSSAEVSLDRAKVHGETAGFEGVDQLVGALKDFRCFQEIKRGKVQKTKDGSKVEFDLDIRVQCNAGGDAVAEGA